MNSVAVLAGGCSPEHDVSLRSALQVLEHVDRARWQPWPVLLDRQGLWWVADRPLAPDEMPGPDYRVPGMRGLRAGSAIEHLLEVAHADVVFPVLHGPGGEDGTVQGMLELHDLPFVGSSCAASAVAMDKIRTRECLAFHGLPMAPCWISPVPLARAEPDATSDAIRASVGFPCFLKVDCSGSSIGVARALAPADVTRFLAENRARGGRFLAEAQVDGEEITVPVLGNWEDALTPLPPIGIYPRRGAFFTHAAKYEIGGSDEIVPPRGLTPAQCERAQALAARCHAALCCDGMSRTDMIWTAGGAVVLEVNTIPGLTAQSLLPKSARAHGLSFRALLDTLLDLTLARARRGALAS